tara:strand:+ start:406 stop:591 length:186 start_codon:yes stop_codon:yes gene_type:complete
MINTVEKIYSVYDGTHISYSVTYIDSNLSASVPLNEANTDYQAILTWIADGGTVIDNGGGE